MEGDAEAPVLYSVHDGVATLTLNRPERLNAWTPDMEEAYFDRLEQADDDGDVRVIVVTGSGQGFCPGMDSSVLAGRAAAAAPLSDRRRPMTFPLSIRKMTIASINGACAGIGLIQALCCDVRFAASDARIATAFVRRGLAPEFGVGWLMTRIIGAGRAADLLLSSRTLSGMEAQEIGLVSKGVPAQGLVAEVERYARDVAVHCSPRAIAYAKADLLLDWNRTRELAEQDALQVTGRDGHRDDFREGIQSLLDKGPPSFENLPPVWGHR